MNYNLIASVIYVLLFSPALILGFLAGMLFTALKAGWSAWNFWVQQVHKEFEEEEDARSADY